MCCSDAFSVSTGSVFVSGVVAMWSVDLQLDDVVLDSDREGVHGDVGGQCLRLARAQIEQRSVTGALDGAVLGIQLPLGERTVVVRAAVLEREQLAVAVEDADLEVLPLDDARGTGRELRERADVDGLRHGGKGPPSGSEKSDADGLNCIGRSGPARPSGRSRRTGHSTRASRSIPRRANRANTGARAVPNGSPGPPRSHR